jgi:hypothetical protein
VVQEPLHSRLSMEGGNIPIAAALHPDSPAGNLRKACAAVMLKLDVESETPLVLFAANSNMQIVLAARQCELCNWMLSSCGFVTQMYGKPAAFDIEAGAGPGISTVPLAPACSSRRLSASDSDYEDAMVCASPVRATLAACCPVPIIAMHPEQMPLSQEPYGGLCEEVWVLAMMCPACAGDGIRGQPEVAASAAVAVAVAAAAAAAAGVAAPQADPAHAHPHGDIHARQIAAQQVGPYNKSKSLPMQTIGLGGLG